MIERVETGKVQIGDDWPAVLIRGDHALHFAMTLQNYLANPSDDFMAKAVLKGLADTLSGADARNGVGPVKLTRVDLAQAPAPARVKPLVWVQNAGGAWDARTAFGTNYSVADSQWTYGPTRVWFGADGGDEAAKAAAQADYEARILAALEAPDAGVVAELVEARDRLAQCDDLRACLKGADARILELGKKLQDSNGEAARLRDRLARMEGAVANLPAVYAHQINTGVREVYDPLQRFFTLESVLSALTDGGSNG